MSRCVPANAADAPDPVRAGRGLQPDRPRHHADGASERTAPNGIAFAVGFLAAQAIVCGVGFAIGAASTSGPFSGKTAILGVLEVVVGVALLGAAWRRAPAPRAASPSAPAAETGSHKGETRSRHEAPASAARALASLGLLFGVGLKRLLITLLAVAHINVASLPAIEEAALIVLFIAVASIPVVVPVGIYVVAGRRAQAGSRRRRPGSRSIRTTSGSTRRRLSAFCS